MGVDLCRYGNHTIAFRGKTYPELATEIKAGLGKIEISNLRYIKYALVDNFIGTLKFEKRVI